MLPPPAIVRHILDARQPLRWRNANLLLDASQSVSGSTIQNFVSFQIGQVKFGMITNCIPVFTTEAHGETLVVSNKPIYV